MRVGASRTYRPFFRARAAALGLFVCLAGCGGHPSPQTLARAYDRAEGTGLYSWLVAHDPSALVAWDAPVAHLHDVVPDARLTIVTLGADPCAEATRAHAALVTLLPHAAAASRRDRALDCGIALFRDPGGLVIAPR